jgi:hypothetical protein
MPGRDPHTALIDRLVADAPPVRRRWSPGRRLAFWLALPGAGIAVAALSAPWPLRDPASRPPLLALELVVLAMAAAALAALALRAAVPGREPGRWPVALAVALAMSSTLCWFSVGSATAPQSLAAFVAGGMPCAVATTAYALLPTGALLWALRRGAPLAPIRAGLLGGSGGFLAGYLIMRIACPHDDPAHLLAWHGLPAGIGIAACAAAGAWWLAGWRRRPS